MVHVPPREQIFFVSTKACTKSRHFHRPRGVKRCWDGCLVHTWHWVCGGGV